MPTPTPPFDLGAAYPSTLHQFAVLDHEGDLVAGTLATTKSEAISAFTRARTVADGGQPLDEARRARAWEKARARGFRAVLVVVAEHYHHYELDSVATWAAELVRLLAPDAPGLPVGWPKTPADVRAVRRALQGAARAHSGAKR